MAGASLVAATLKGEERVIMEWVGNGPLKTVYAEASRSGEVRGFVDNPEFDMPSATPLGYALRTGLLKVTNILYNMAKPYTSTIEMAGGDIVSDLGHYFHMVEQIPTYIDLESLVNETNSEVMFSGGIFIQPLPQPNPKETKQVIDDYKEHLRRLPPISSLFIEDKKSLRQVLDVVTMHPADIKDENIEKHVMEFFLPLY